MFMLLRVEVHPGLLLGGENLGTATLPLHGAVEEAWMSITALHRIAARWRFGTSAKGLGWALAVARAFSGITQDHDGQARLFQLPLPGRHRRPGECRAAALAHEA